MPAAPLPPAKPRVDVRALSLTQLQTLAARGSRRARAELEGRMRAAGAVATPAAPARPTAMPAAAAAHTLTVRAEGAAPRPAATPTPAPTRPPLSATERAMPALDLPRPPPEQLAERLQLIAQQDETRARADGPPRLVGLVLIAWGVLLTLGGLLMATRGGGLYYLVCGLGTAAVGWLLMQCSRWALALHGALALLALVWAWGGGAQRSLPLALLQAAPVLVAALWMALRPVREPLE